MADISRDDVATLIQEEYTNVLLESAEVASASLSAFTTVPLGTKITNAPVLATLPEASWVSESSSDPAGVKPTSKATWSNKQFVVEEIAVIIPIHEDALEDMTEDGITRLTQLGGTAIGKKLDQAILFGTDKPSTWASAALLPAATAAGAVFQVSATPGEDDLAGSIWQAADRVDQSGADPSVILSRRGLRFRLMNLRDGEGGRLWQGDPGGEGSIAGLDAAWVRNGAWNSAAATALIADRERVMVGVRQDITVKYLDQATLGTGENQINLAERDMVAFRFKARYAYVLGNTLTAEGVTAVPVAAVTPAAGS